MATILEENQEKALDTEKILSIKTMRENRVLLRSTAIC